MKSRIIYRLPRRCCAGWFAARCDLILLLFDPHKLDISDEFKEVRPYEHLEGQYPHDCPGYPPLACSDGGLRFKRLIRTLDGSVNAPLTLTHQELSN